VFLDADDRLELMPLPCFSLRFIEILTVPMPTLISASSVMRIWSGLAEEFNGL